MKHVFKLGMALLIIAIVFGMGACKFDDDGDENNSGYKSGKDFTNHQTSGKIHVRNLTKENLLAFMDTISEQTFIGGIPGGADQHGLKNDTVLGGQPKGFAMVLITEQQYLDNKANLSAASLKENPFCRVYIYYNPNRRNDDPIKNYEISGNLGGNFKLIVSNPTGYNVELRLGGVDGETIGYAPTGLINSNIYLTEGDFDIFPVFKSYNVVRDTINTHYPKGVSGYPWFKGVNFRPGSGDQYFNVKDASDTVINGATMGAAWIILNNSSKTAVRVLKGSAPIISPTGVSYISDGTKQTFQIDMDTVAVSGYQSFSGTTTLDNLSIGPSGFTVPLEKEDGSKTGIVLKTDMVYTITVTGSHNDGNLKAVINIDDGEEVKFTPVS